MTNISTRTYTMTDRALTSALTHPKATCYTPIPIPTSWLSPRLNPENRKTGNMIQVWILCANESPVAAVKSGSDGIVCGDCKHRGNGFSDRTCYVNVGQGALLLAQSV
jgi:hypothetical protein